VAGVFCALVEPATGGAGDGLAAPFNFAVSPPHVAGVVVGHGDAGFEGAGPSTGALVTSGLGAVSRTAGVSVVSSLAFAVASEALVAPAFELRPLVS
jgi:hypothetical protein